jgi:hypothetical protein
MDHCSSSGGSLLECGDVEQNPGPGHLRVVTANVTLLRSHFEAVIALPAEVLALQETLSEEAAQHFLPAFTAVAGRPFGENLNLY